jgi:hypothetical protein
MKAIRSLAVALLFAIPSLALAADGLIAVKSPYATGETMHPSRGCSRNEA